MLAGELEAFIQTSESVVNGDPTFTRQSDVRKLFGERRISAYARQELD